MTNCQSKCILLIYELIVYYNIILFHFNAMVIIFIHMEKNFKKINTFYDLIFKDITVSLFIKI